MKYLFAGLPQTGDEQFPLWVQSLVRACCGSPSQPRTKSPYSFMGGVSSRPHLFSIILYTHNSKWIVFLYSSIPIGRCQLCVVIIGESSLHLSPQRRYSRKLAVTLSVKECVKFLKEKVIEHNPSTLLVYCGRLFQPGRLHSARSLNFD